MIGIQEIDISRRLGQDNPWWSGEPRVPGFYADLPYRLYFDGFQKLVEDTSIRRAVILMGPRRVGKTVLLFQSIKTILKKDISPTQIVYISIDTPTYTGLSLEKLLELATTQGGLDLNKEAYIYFDEIQYLKDWERHLKSLVDSFPSVKFVVSGSAAAALKLKSQESGAGRFTDFLLPPLTFAEFVLFSGHRENVLTSDEATGELEFTGDINILNDLFIRYINFGGYPEAIFSESIQKDPARFIRNDIIDKVLLRDLPSLYGISDIQDLNRLFTHLAYHTGEEVSLDGLSQASGLAKNTIKKYIEYLEAAFLIAISRRLDQNAKTFKKEHAFKVYLANPSMYSALFAPVLDENDERFGHLIETAYVSQRLHAVPILGPPYYARWKNGEIDLVEHSQLNNAITWASEVKWSDRIVKHTDELRQAIIFCKNNNFSFLLVTTKSIAGATVIDSVKVNFIPCSSACFIMGQEYVSGAVARSLNKRTV